MSDEPLHIKKEMCKVTKGVHHFDIRTGNCRYCNSKTYDGMYKKDWRTNKLKLR
jgi:hypothetical protein